MMTKNHNYFLLSFNPWALFLSLVSFNLLFSILMFFKYSSPHSFFASLFLTSLCSFVWWVNFSKEFGLEGKESFNLEEGVKFSMILFISSEIFFFFSFFWSYFHFFFAPTIENSLQWPPLMVESFDFSAVPLINTLVLVSSGVTVTLSHHFISNGGKKLSMIFLLLTIFLGLFFTYLQWVEYNNSFFTLSDSTFGTSFFMLTGFHGIHVIIGSIFLFVVFLRGTFLVASKSDFVSFELSSWYWHFVDVVWLFLYFCLYYLND